MNLLIINVVVLEYIILDEIPGLVAIAFLPIILHVCTEAINVNFHQSFCIQPVEVKKATKWKGMTNQSDWIATTINQEYYVPELAH